MIKPIVMIINEHDLEKEIIPHFRIKEFICKDGSYELILSPKILIMTNILRTFYDEPITVTSAYRTVYHNKAVGGHEKSRHLKGEAIDFLLPKGKQDRHTLIYLCKKIFPHTIEGDEYIHCSLKNEPYNWEELWISEDGNL